MISGGAGLLAGALGSGLMTGFSVNSVKNRTIADLNHQIEQNNIEITNLKKTCSDLEAKLKNQPNDEGLKKEIEKLTTDNNNLKKQKEDAELKVNEKELEITTKIAIIDNKEKELTKLNKQIDALNEALKGGKGENAITELNNQLNNAKIELSTANQKVIESEQKASELNLKMTQSTAKIENLKNEKVNLVKQVTQNEKKIEELQKQIVDMETKNGDNTKLAEQVTKKENRIKELEQKLEKMTKSNEMEEKIKELKCAVEEVFNGEEYNKEKVINTLRLGQILSENLNYESTAPVKGRIYGSWKDWWGLRNTMESNHTENFPTYGKEEQSSNSVQKWGLVIRTPMPDGNELIGKLVNNIRRLAEVSPEKMAGFLNFAINLANKLGEAAQDNKYGLKSDDLQN